MLDHKPDLAIQLRAADRNLVKAKRRIAKLEKQLQLKREAIAAEFTDVPEILSTLPRPAVEAALARFKFSLDDLRKDERISWLIAGKIKTDVFVTQLKTAIAKHGLVVKKKKSAVTNAAPEEIH
jgi:hypothetical protein